MKKWKVRMTKIFSILVCFALLTGSTLPIEAKKNSKDLQKEADQLNEKSKDLEKEQSEINKNLTEIGGEISSLEQEIAEVENDIDTTNNSIEVTEETLSIAKYKKNEQYEAMKLRIKYMYENDNVSLLGMLFSADDMQDFLNKADFIQNISEYDRVQLSELIGMMNTIKAQQEELEAKKASLQNMQSELDEKEHSLKVAAKSMSADLTEIKVKIASLKEEAAAKAEAAAAAKAAEEAAAAAKAAAEAAAAGEKAPANPGAYNYPSGNGVLTKSKGVNYYNGHKETWYSQRVLPGGGLNIPGRHVRSDGVICDKDGYVCVASEDYPKGTVVETSLGTAKVYDCGCAHGVIDIYVDW